MALVTISGYPSSGKSTRALQLKKYFEDKISEPVYEGPLKNVVLISDDSLGLTRDGYNDGRAEKPQRAALFTAVQRNLGTSTVVIVDGLNYIKGFRYQMYCAAREAQARVATLFVAATPEICRTWHQSKPEDARYTEATFENLIQRYEEPSSMVRWDSPLFTVPWNEAETPVEGVWQAITAGVLKPPNAGTKAIAKPPADALQALETTAATIVATIMEAQGLGGSSGGKTRIWSKSGGQTETAVYMQLPARTVTLAELQRLKRQFVSMHKKAITQGATENGPVDWTEDGIAEKLGDYLEERLVAGV
ncbi:Protein kti12 [Serendipita indica DSM 11827]|uniref:Related to KTI12-Elongator associated protein n=1 Tax=Serendipita indica (strain DSM 11827) TaxID=1109443 RepID=G4T8G3_SERID|nr:Protein kti12 [Serendipita indica DSM 11827]CCA67604.1 related to KTI12-Elongator associated protein [Serendipita indica DSM 11827]